MRIYFDFFDLQAFLAVAELGSFQRAADNLNVSQSAITRRIQKLEKSLDVVFFERSTRSLKLTLAAKNFRQRAEAILDDTEEALRTLGDDSRRYEYQRNATISIAAIPTATHKILPSVIEKFHRHWQDTRINILDLLSNDVIEAVAQGDADFGISVLGLQEPGLIFDALSEDNFVLVMHYSNPLCEKLQIQWNDINEQRLIVPWKGTGNRLLIDNAMARSKTRLNSTFQVHHSSTAISFVKAALGVAVLPSSAISHLDDSLLISRPLVDPELVRVLGTVRRSGDKLSKGAQQLYELFHEQDEL